MMMVVKIVKIADCWCRLGRTLTLLCKTGCCAKYGGARLLFEVVSLVTCWNYTVIVLGFFGLCGEGAERIKGLA